MVGEIVSPESKLLSNDEVVRRYGRPRDLRVVFTNGCFDLLHRGHVEVLYAARRLGDALVVGLNSDESVKRLKGAARPLNPELDRALVLAGLAAVDAITVFPEDTPREIISRLLPDVLVKGGDYAAAEVVGAPEVEAAGGRVVIVPLVPGRSTSTIIERVLSADD